MVFVAKRYTLSKERACVRYRFHNTQLNTPIAASGPQAGPAYAAGPKIFRSLVGLQGRSPKTDGLGPVTQATPVGWHKVAAVKGAQEREPIMQWGFLEAETAEKG